MGGRGGRRIYYGPSKRLRTTVHQLYMCVCVCVFAQFQFYITTRLFCYFSVGTSENYHLFLTLFYILSRVHTHTHTHLSLRFVSDLVGLGKLILHRRIPLDRPRIFRYRFQLRSRTCDERRFQKTHDARRR